MKFGAARRFNFAAVDHEGMVQRRGNALHLDQRRDEKEGKQETEKRRKNQGLLN